MPTTYKATLCDNVLEWKSDAPRELVPGHAIEVTVVVPDAAVPDATALDLHAGYAQQAQDEARGAELSKAERGRLMAAALEEIVQAGTFPRIEAAAWEREERVDRQLPGRE